MQPMTLDEIKRQADRAIKAGRYDEAEALLARGNAIKAGPEALAAFERAAEAGAHAPAFVKALRAGRLHDRRIDRAMDAAVKAELLAEVDDDAQRLADELHQGNYADLAHRKQRALITYLKGGPIDDTLARAVVLSPAQILEAVQLGMSASEVKSTMVESQDQLGGVLVPNTTSERIMARAGTLAVVRPRAFVEVSSAGPVAIPVIQGSGNVYPSRLRGAMTTEVQTLGTSNEEVLALSVATPPINLWRVWMPISRSLLEDAGPRLMNAVERFLAETKAVREDQQFLTGTGVKEPLGVLAPGATAGTLANPDVAVVASGSATAITADGVINLIYGVPGQYRNSPTFATSCNAATLKQIRLLKDGSGRYLYDERDRTLCGYPLAESESMPDIAAGAFPLACGDFQGYAVVDRIGLSIERLASKTDLDQDRYLYVVRSRYGGQPVEGYRFAALKIATS